MEQSEPWKEVSIIIIEYFSLDAVLSCVSTIEKKLGPLNYEIIISSNSCYDRHKQESIIRAHSGISWLFNEENGGFGYAMNRGLAKSVGRFMVITNPDIIFLDGFVKMVEFMEHYPEVGAAGPQMVNSEGQIQDNCRPYVSVNRYLARQVRRIISGNEMIYERDFDYRRIQTVDWLAGAFIMVRRAVYEVTSGLDENYFMYAEDLDWCTRIRKSGYEVVYFPEMKVIYSGTRLARNINNYTWIFIKSHIRFWCKFGFFSGYPKRKEMVFDK